MLKSGDSFHNIACLSSLNNIFLALCLLASSIYYLQIPPSNDVLQQPGTWVNGRWVSSKEESLREANLQALAEMGFWNRDLNATLLARFNDDLTRVVGELVQ